MHRVAHCSTIESLPAVSFTLRNSQSESLAVQHRLIFSLTHTQMQQIKPMILGRPGTAIEIGFVPVNARAFSASPFGALDPSRSNKDVVTVTLTRAVRVDASVRSKDESGTGTSQEQESKPWFGTVWSDLRKATEKAGKSMETNLVAVGDKLGEAGSAIGKTAKAGWDGTSKAVTTVGKNVHEGSKVAADKINEAGTKVKETVGVDAAARERLTQLEEENKCVT
jgi:hypothetical protein